MEAAEPQDAGSQLTLWEIPRVERTDWTVGGRQLADCATYRVVGGQRHAFEALRAFSEEHLEPIVVDLYGLNDTMKKSFLGFLESTGLTVVEWVSEDVVVLTNSSSRRDGGAGVREPAHPPLPSGNQSAEAPLEH